MDCGVCAATGGDFSLMRMAAGGGNNGGFSHESEHDLALMVSDFLENGSGDSHRYSSDSDSSFSDLANLADKISCYKLSADQYERDLLSVVDSLMQSISEIDLHLVKPGPCNASCIRFTLVKLLRLSGYDAAVCASKWQGSGKVPGGDHEYIDVVNYNDTRNSDRLIIDIDFRSHFEIARAVDSYDRILNSLPVAYVGSLNKLKQYLQVMVEAARSSLKQNSMPFPPWRSLAYLQAKWQSPYHRHYSAIEEKFKVSASSEHKQCFGHLKRLQALIQSEMEVQRLLTPRNSDKSRILNLERRRLISYRTL